MALVLTRKLNEIVKIGEDVFIQIARVNRGSVRLSIHAPETLGIQRLTPSRACEIGFQKQDWEFSDQELLEKIYYHLNYLRSDPFNGSRKNDVELAELFAHASERLKKMQSIN